MDCGNLLKDPYETLAQIALQTVLVHAKTYFGGGEWYTLDLDHGRVADILDKVDFTGHVSLEYEGRQDPLIAVPKSADLLREHFGR
jgi:hypothetical protein